MRTRTTNMNRRRSSGQVLVLACLCMVVLLGFLGLAIDGGNLYVNRRGVQNAADAGALAGAYVMANSTSGTSASDSAVLAQVVEYVGLNGVPNASQNVAAFYTDKNGVRVGVQLPNNGTAPTTAVGIEVIPTKNVNTLFLNALGIASSTVSARAGAKSSPSSTTTTAGFGVFAHNTNDAEAIKTTGPNYNIVGTIHSNSGITNSGPAYTIDGSVQYVSTITGTNTWSITPPFTASVSTVEPYPVSYQTSDFAPGSAAATAAGTFYHSISGNLDLASFGGTVPPGLYYVTGNVTGSSQFNAPNVTIVAVGTIDFSAPQSTLTAYVDNLALFSGASGEAQHISSGGTSTWTGLIFAPNGAIDFSMPNGNLSGGLIGDTIDITGPNANINANGTGPVTPGAPGQIALYE